MPLPQNLAERVGDESSSMRTHAFDTLWEAIYDGTLEPGEELVEAELLGWLNVSRQPLRHALLRLQELGLVILSNGKAPRIASLDPARENRTMMVSTMYNVYCVEQTVGRLTAEQLVRLDDAASDVHEAAASHAHAWMAESVKSFFQVFTDALGNPVIAEQMQVMSWELAWFLVPGASLVDAESLAAPLGRINEAAARGDVQTAATIVRGLYDLTARNFVERFRNAGA